VKCLLACLAPVAALAAVFALPAAAPAPVAAGPEAWAVDPVHSSLLFKIQHGGVSNFYGVFKEFSGNISMDADLSKSTVAFTVQTASVDTRNAKRDQDLTAPDFFSTKEFPTIEFKSSKIEKDGDGWNVTGKLTLHGVTKDVTAKVTQTGKATGKHGDVAGYEAHFSVKRSDFGMTAGVKEGMVGDQVDLTLAAECHKA
jgi:polyisoprenoid-binding protein YceI